MEGDSSGRFVEIHTKPVSAPRMTQRDKWANLESNKGRPEVLRYLAYKDTIRQAMGEYQLPTELHLTFLFEMPKSWSKKKQAEKAGQLHDQKPDIDNLCKAFLDAFHSEDKRVAKLHAEKYWGGVDAVLVRAES